MTERPILFSAPMVRALLDGTKTQRRQMGCQPVGMGRRIQAGATMTPWALAITQMRRPDAPRPMARDDRNALIFGAARRLIANSAGGRCRMHAIAIAADCPAQHVTAAIYGSDEFAVSKQPGDRALWVSLATRRKARRT